MFKNCCSYKKNQTHRKNNFFSLYFIQKSHLNNWFWNWCCIFVKTRHDNFLFPCVEKSKFKWCITDDTWRKFIDITVVSEASPLSADRTIRHLDRIHGDLSFLMTCRAQYTNNVKRLGPSRTSIYLLFGTESTESRSKTFKMMDAISF